MTRITRGAKPDDYEHVWLEDAKRKRPRSVKKFELETGQNLPASLGGEEPKEAPASGERRQEPGTVVATDDAEASRDPEEQPLDVLQADALEVNRVEKDADTVAAERPTGASEHNDEQHLTPGTLPPVYDCGGQEVGTVFPKMVVEIIVCHSISDDNIKARAADIERLTGALQRATGVMELLLRGVPEMVIAMRDGLGLEMAITLWQPEEELATTAKARWQQLTTTLAELTNEQNADEARKADLEWNAVQVLLDMYRDYSKHPKTQAYEQEIKHHVYQRQAFLEEVASQGRMATPHSTGAQSQHALDRGPEQTREHIRTEAKESAFSGYRDTKLRLAIADVLFREWRDANDNIDRDESSDVHREHLLRGHTVARRLSKARKAYSDALTEARRLNAVPSDMLTGHFYRYSDSHNEDHAAQVDDASEAHEDDPRIEEWRAHIRLDNDDASDLVQKPAGSISAVVQKLQPFDFGESWTWVWLAERPERYRRYIKQNRLAHTQQFEGMLAKWPDERIARPPVHAQGSKKRKRADSDSSERPAKRVKTTRSTSTRSDDHPLGLGRLVKHWYPHRCIIL